MTRISALALLGLMTVSALFMGNTSQAADPAPPEKKPDAKKSDDKKPADNDKDTQAALEKKFAETMSGVTLTGHYTLGEMKGDKMPKEDNYTISKVTKLAGDTWLFNVNIKYGANDVTLPLPLEVKWAGDTPVITLTKAAVPGLGTFTARVLFYEDSYAGTWNGGDHGGVLFGKYAKKAADPAKAVEKKSEAPAPK